jgi:hypothetical protein
LFTLDIINMALSRFDRRIRIVSFRISEREYKALREFCAAHGFRGISDLTRRAIRDWFMGTGALDNPELPVSAIHGHRDERKEMKICSKAQDVKFFG